MNGAKTTKSGIANAISVEKIGVVTLRRLKHSSSNYYVTIEKDLVYSYGLLIGDVLKIAFLEARKDHERAIDETKRQEE